ncbi:MAG: hypothetical protein WCE90_04070 [Candidatus Zixiibacteriota bacterium]
MQVHDLAVAWCWKYDADFVFQIDSQCVKRELSPYLIHPHNLFETIKRMEGGELGFKVFFDRASDQEEDFEQLVDMMQKREVKMINDVDRATWATDKATMHLEFLSHGIHVPYTIILPPWDERPNLHSIQLDKVGIPFVIKPACGGCGDGVVLDARTIQDVQAARQQFPEDKYLVQEKINPVEIDGRRAWFRVFFACGEIIPCWWDDHTKIADALSPSEIDQHVHSSICHNMRKIAGISQLDLFSTEIALALDGRLLVIDHVNDQVDLRKKSSHLDGIPDEVVDGIVMKLVDWVEKEVRPGSSLTEPSRCKES